MIRDHVERIRAEAHRLKMLAQSSNPFMSGVYHYRSNRLYEQADLMELRAIEARYKDSMTETHLGDITNVD